MNTGVPTAEPENIRKISSLIRGTQMDPHLATEVAYKNGYNAAAIRFLAEILNRLESLQCDEKTREALRAMVFDANTEVMRLM